MFLKQSGGKFVWVKDGYTNVSVEVDVNKLAGPANAWSGVTCRMQDGAGGYAFEISMDGSYSIEKWTFGATDSDDTLADGTLDSRLLKLNGPNHIRAICAQDTLSLFVNEQFITQTSDGSFAAGGFGLVSLTGDSGAGGVDYLYSNFIVKEP